MAVTENVLISLQNKERFISEIIKANRGRRLEDVELKGNTLELKFSDRENWAVKTTVKQYAKRKYDSIPEFKKNFSLLSGIYWRVVKVIDLPDVWLAFYERNHK